jgi:ketosteroid isomerase-like protein|tara:strand:+ start:681 stop:1121 length:441 start_codon:yes stop_codon:yes gene_type:complete
MKNMRYLILLSILLLNSSYGLTNTLKIVDLGMIDSLWVINYNNDNTMSLVNLYTHDAMVFPPSSEILEGPIAITNYLNNLREAGFNEYSISNVDTQVRESTAYTTALWEAIRIGVDGNKIKLDGNITNVLERQNDGNWKIKLQSWN